MLSISELVFSVILVGLVMIGKSPLHRLFSKKSSRSLLLKRLMLKSPRMSYVAFLSMAFFLLTKFSRFSQNFWSLVLRGGLYKLVIKCDVRLVLIFMVRTSSSSGCMNVRSSTMLKSVPDLMQNATPPPFCFSRFFVIGPMYPSILRLMVFSLIFHTS